MRLPLRLIVLDGMAMMPRSGNPEIAVRHCRGTRDHWTCPVHLFPQHIRILSDGEGSMWTTADHLYLRRS